jgi:hypothetical protein
VSNTNATWANASFGIGVASVAAAVIVYVVAKHRMAGATDKAAAVRGRRLGQSPVRVRGW